MHEDRGGRSSLRTLNYAKLKTYTQGITSSSHSSILARNIEGTLDCSLSEKIIINAGSLLLGGMGSSTGHAGRHRASAVRSLDRC